MKTGYSCMLGLFVLLPHLVWAEVRYVQVDQTRLLSRPTSFSKAIALLAYRTPVEVLQTSGGYVKVRAGKKTGYLPQRSLTLRKPVFASKISGAYLTSSEIAMATKGFNAQVESDYRKNNPALHYADLDALEAATRYPDPAETFKAFRRAGRLGEFAGPEAGQ